MPIRKYKTQKGTIRYRAELCVQGKRSSKSFDNKLDAAIWEDKKERELLTGEVAPGEVATGDMLLIDAMDRCVIESRGQVSRAQNKIYEYAQLSFSRSFPRKTMSELTHQDVAAHVLKRMTGDGVGASSIRNELSFLRKVYVKAVDWGIEYPSPELSIVRPRHKVRSREDRQDKVISVPELNAIFEEAGKRQNNLLEYLRFLLFTGMRPSEAALLYWNRLPGKEEKIAGNNKRAIGYVDLARGGFSKVGTKTETRFVPAHPEAIKIIKKLSSNKAPGEKLVFLADKYQGRDDGYKYYRRSMQTTLKNARIDGERIRKDINFYSFRHTARSSMARCGIPTEVAETIIGHNDKSFKFTYIHLDDAVLVKEIAKLEFVGLIFPL